jgi:TonB-dependent starch-binding outer membrane protein SusC
MSNQFKTKVKTIFLSFLLIGIQQIVAQKNISGVITDGSNNEPLIGSSISIKGKSTGTVTDVYGRYSIKASPTDVLVFSYIGLEKQEVEVGKNEEINIVLMPKSNQLSEVVAIGYGTVVKKSDLTGSIAVVSAKDISKNPSNSAAQALQGKAPGVLVTQSGQPGGGATIRVRGVGSISKGADPIYIVDGVQVGGIESLPPQDIDNIQVLKDASATAIYGANGSNGVIIINTKRGKSGKPQVNLTTNVGISLKPVEYRVMNAQEYSDFYSSVKYSQNGLGKTFVNSAGQTVQNPAYAYSPEFRQKYYGEGWEQGTNWQDLLFNTGLNQNYTLSVAGGGEGSNFNISFGYNNEKGNVIKSNAERFTFRANSDFKLSKYVKIGENFSLNYNTSETPMTVSSTVWDLNASPLMRVYNPYYKGGFESYQTNYWEATDGSLQISNVPAGTMTYANTVGNDKPNPYAAPALGSNKAYGPGIVASFYFQLDLTNWLMYKITPSAFVVNNRNRAWMPLFEGNRSTNQATLTEGYGESVGFNIEQQLVFKKQFNDVHNVQATLVYQANGGTYNGMTATVNGFDFEQLNTMSNGGTNSKSIAGWSSDQRQLSYLGRLMYDYKGKYFVTASVRSDGTYLFAPEYRRGTFYSASGAWKINEDFLKNVKELDALKLRIGWGKTGNSNVGGGFQYVDKISDAVTFSPVFGDNQQIAQAQYVFYGMASPDMHWETAEMTNIGIDATLFNSRLQFTGEYYIKNNNDLLIAMPTSMIFGRIDGKPWVNSGKIQNRGVELSLQWRDKINDFNYGFLSTFTTIKNEVLYMPVSDITNNNNRTIVGHSIGALYGFATNGIIQLDESNYTKDATGSFSKDALGNYTGYKHALYNGNVPQPGDIQYVDLNGDGKIDNLDKTIIGKTIPSFTYTLGFDCSYKNFDFNMFLFGVSDFQIYNQQRATLSSVQSIREDGSKFSDMEHNKLLEWAQNRWTPTNPSTNYVRYDPGDTNVNEQISSFWIEDGSFLRIKDVQLGYNFTKNSCKSLGISSLRIYGNASNLYCFTAYKGRDPEGLASSNPIASGTDTGNYSVPRTFSVGLQIGF